MNKKYEFTEETKVVRGCILHRIKRLKDVAIGGWIEKDSNLSHEGKAWVSGDAEVSGGAWVSGDAEVSGDARVSGGAWVSGKAMVSDNARILDNAWVSGNAEVLDNAWVSGDARVSGKEKITKSPINIIGIAHNVTITKKYMTIGCQTKTIADWEKITEHDAISMDGVSGSNFYRFFKHTLLSLIKYHTQVEVE